MRFKLIFMFGFMIILLSCSDKPKLPPDPIPTYDTFKLPSSLLGEERTINIWTPPIYTTSEDSLPVLYMLDGGVEEDFPHIANTLSELIESKKIPPIILVGIENTQRRRDLTGPTQVEKDKEIAPIVGESLKFRAFVNDELFNEINKKYRTTKVKGIIGESLAGLFVTENLMLKPDMFDFYIAFDPSLWWNDQHLNKTTKDHLANFPTSKKKFWFAGSSAEDISSTVGQLAKTLEEIKVESLTWKYSPEPKEEHSTIFRATKEKALIWTLNDNE